MFYVNKYEVERCYGGPEEGGWWYDSGEFVECLGVFTDQESAWSAADAEEENAEKTRYDRFSVLGGADAVIRVETEPGASYPEHAPHYE